MWNYQNFSFAWRCGKAIVWQTADFIRYTIIMHSVKTICQQRSSTISTHFQIFVYFGRFVVVVFLSICLQNVFNVLQKTHTQRERNASTNISWQWCVSIPTSFLLTIDWLICCHSTLLCNSLFSHRHTRQTNKFNPFLNITHTDVEFKPWISQSKLNLVASNDLLKLPFTFFLLNICLNFNSVKN